MHTYHHTVQYYETDRMQITHHSNYVRWMEEARTAMLNDLGWSYAELEAQNIISPVVSVNCHYQKTTTFADDITIKTAVAHVSAAKLELAYTMECHGQVVCQATSTHCFLDSNNHIINLKRTLPEFFAALKQHQE